MGRERGFREEMNMSQTWMRGVGGLGMAILAVISFAATPARADDAKKEKHWTKKFSKMDTDKDGSVSQAEFVAFKAAHPRKHEVKNRAEHRQKKFDKIDTNHDGKVTLDEFLAWKRAHPHHQHAKKNKKSAGNDAAPAPAPAPEK
jgi:hypothetical protein